MTSRQEQAANTRKHIYEVSMALFDEYGFDKVTIGQICTAAGISTGAFYHHYEKKEDILVEQYRMIDRKLWLTDFEQLQGKSWFDKVVEYTGLYAESAQKDGYRVVNEVYRAWLTLHRPFVAENEGFQKSLQSLLSHGLEAGEFRSDTDVRQLAVDILIIVRGIIYYWCQHQGDFLLCPKTEDMIRNYMTMYLSEGR